MDHRNQREWTEIQSLESSASSQEVLMDLRNLREGTEIQRLQSSTSKEAA
jgi:hypothetical protein